MTKNPYGATIVNRLTKYAGSICKFIPKKERSKAMSRDEKLMPIIEWPYRELIIFSRIEGVIANMRENNAFLLGMRSISNPVEFKNSYPTRKVLEKSRPQQILLFMLSDNNPLFPLFSLVERNQFHLVKFEKTYEVKGTVYVLVARKEDFPSKEAMAEAIKTITAKFVKDEIYYPLDVKAKAEALERFKREHLLEYEQRLAEGALNEFVT